MRTTVMIYKYFVGCTSQEDIKVRYRTLAKKHHPDMPSGNADTFKELSNEYAYLTGGNSHTTFPVSNVKSAGRSKPFDFEFDPDIKWEASSKGSNDIWEDFLRQQKEAAQQDSKDPVTRYWIGKELTDPLFSIVKDIIVAGIDANKTANWLLMEIYKLDDLGLDHFKYIRWKMDKLTLGIVKFKESWVGEAYRNYISVKRMKWQ